MARCWFRAHSLVADVSVDDCLRCCRGILAMISRELYWSLHILKWRFELLDLSSGRCVNLLCDIRVLWVHRTPGAFTVRTGLTVLDCSLFVWTPFRCLFLFQYFSNVFKCLFSGCTGTSMASYTGPQACLVRMTWWYSACPVLRCGHSGLWSLYSPALLNFFVLCVLGLGTLWSLSHYPGSYFVCSVCVFCVSCYSICFIVYRCMVVMPVCCVSSGV
jgi:hypothetical protein